MLLSCDSDNIFAALITCSSLGSKNKAEHVPAARVGQTAEFAMRTTRKVAQAKEGEYGQEVRSLNTRPHRVSGGVTTSWRGPPHIDLPKLFAAPLPEATITSSAHGPPKAIKDRSCFDGTLLLSDGTYITFVTAPTASNPEVSDRPHHRTFTATEKSASSRKPTRPPAPARSARCCAATDSTL
jgi:hypothetical protein